jgi:hypothetical protein
MATPAERMRALRERARRGVRREDDLQALAQRGYEGAASTDHDQRAKAVGLSSATRFCKSDRVNRRSNVSRDGVTSRTVSPCRAGHGSSVTISKDEFAEIARFQRRQTRTRDAAGAIGRSTIACLDRTGWFPAK